MTVPFTPSAGSSGVVVVIRAVCSVLLLRELVLLRLLCVMTSIYIRVASVVICYELHPLYPPLLKLFPFCVLF